MKTKSNFIGRCVCIAILFSIQSSLSGQTYNQDVTINSGSGAELNLNNTKNTPTTADDVKWQVVSGVNGGFEIGKVTSDGSMMDTNAPLLISNAGKVGLGVLNPSGKLHVNGESYFANGWLRINTTNKGLYFQQHGGGLYMKDNSWLRTYGNKNFLVNGQARAKTFYANGSYGDHVYLQTYRNANWGNARTRSQLVFGNNTANTFNDYFSIIHRWKNSSNAFTYREIMRMMPSGKVGIGAINPQAKLHVAGNTKIDGTLSIDLGLSTKKSLVFGHDSFDDDLRHFRMSGTTRDIDGEQTENISFSELHLTGPTSIFPPTYRRLMDLNKTKTIVYSELIVAKQLIEDDAYASTEFNDEDLKWYNRADYVFDQDYDLMSLEETEVFIKKNKHLPGVKSAKEIAREGYNVMHEANTQLEKIEELTLHLIAHEKQLKAKDSELKALQSTVMKLLSDIELLKKVNESN